MLLTKGLEILATDMGRNGLNQKCWLELVFVTNISSVRWDKITNAKNLIRSRRFTFLLFNNTTTAIALTLRETFERKVIKSTRFKILFPLVVGTTSVFVQFPSKIISDFGDISLLEPLLLLVFGHKRSCHLGLKLLLVGIIGGLDLGLLLLTIFWAAGSFGLSTTASADSFLFFLDLLIHSPPFSKVGETNLVRKFDRVGERVDARVA
ncbi:hypothetical protein HG530_005157 [Fusarium avenaceum]|nr:hypothetical protein HG530_005157 [Fusarium avenaceum]